MPSIGFIPRLDETFNEGRIDQANIDANQPYDVILKWIAKGSNKLDELVDS